jgi:hypothetical protein
MRLRLKKRTSINSIPRTHKEKEMADISKLFYALAMVALVVGLSIPASAQGGAVTCNAFTTPTLARAEGYAELVGDYILQCFGGQPTNPGQVVPSVNVTVFLSTNITSKLTGTASNTAAVFDEALLLIDEPNGIASTATAVRPVLNCGNGTNAPDTSVSGPGVCEIVAPSPNAAVAPGLPNPAATYDGTPGVQGASVPGNGNFGFLCNGAANAAFPGNQPTGAGFFNAPGTDPPAGQYGCGRPNVFQGRLGTAQNTGQNSIVVFAGVPFDPPGTQTVRTLRVTNIRADAEFLGVSSTFTQQAILMSVSFTGTTFVQINNFSGQQLTVATVLRGLSASATAQLGFLQCVSENSRLFNGTASRGDNRDPTVGGGGVGGGYVQPQVTFTEGFQNAWKTKNVSFLQTNVVPTTGGSTGNGTLNTVGTVWAGTINYPGDLAQNATGSNYNTESGWEWVGTAAGQVVGAQTVPNPNPPQAIGTIAVASNGFALFDSNGTGIQSAGVASQGTRLALNFSNQPQGLNIYVPPVVQLVNSINNAVTGVMVLTNTAADGSGSFSPPTGISAAGAASGIAGTTVAAGANPTIGTNALVQVSNGLAVWEILFSDPNSIEKTTVPVVVAYVSNLSANPPIGLPVPGQIEQVAASFAPFYSSASARQPSATLPVPRFIPSNAPLNIIEVVKCACDILFPFVSAASGFDTGIALANTSLDPGAAFGFGATPQQGTVTFFYFGTGNNGAAPPASQTSAVVPAGQVLTYVLSSGGGAIGNNANGLDNRANGFQGYIIAQSGFQWCHAYAFISPLGGGPTSSGVSEGYLGIVLDLAGLNRTAQLAEIRSH